MKIKKFFKDLLQNYPYDFGLLIFISFAIPAAYNLLNRYFIGFMSYDSVVVDQSYEGVEVLLEILLEVFPIAVLALVSRNYLDRKRVAEIIGTALRLQFAITITFVAIFSIFAESFIDWINTPESASGLAREFFITSSFSIPFHSMSLLMLIAIKSLRGGLPAVLIVFTGVLVNFVLDAFFISNFQFSLQLGLIGSAYGKIISSLFMFFVSLFALAKVLKRNLLDLFDYDREIAKSVFSIGNWSGLESMVRNVGYLIGVIAVVNFLEQTEESVIGGYNTAIWVMWAIVLVPVLAWAEATNIAIGNAYGKRDFGMMKNIQMVAGLLVGLYMTIWIIIGNTVWDPLSAWLNARAKPEVLRYSVITFEYLIFPYSLFAIGSILKSHFVGTGKPFWIFVASAVVNLGIYVPLGLVVKSELIQLSFVEFLIVTNVVFLVDFVITLFALRKYGLKDT